MTIKKQFEHIMKITGIMSIIHIIIGIIGIISIQGMGIGLGSLLSGFSSIKMFLYSKEILKQDSSFKENLFFVLKYLKYYLIGIFIIIIGIIIAYFAYKNYLANFQSYIIH